MEKPILNYKFETSTTEPRKYTEVSILNDQELRLKIYLDLSATERERIKQGRILPLNNKSILEQTEEIFNYIKGNNYTESARGEKIQVRIKPQRPENEI